MFIDGFVHQLPDIDPQETEEWLDSLDAVIDVGGRARARYLLARLMERAREQGVGVPAMVTHRLHQHRSRPSRSRGSRATRSSSGASAPTSGGTRWRWSTARTTASTASVATSRRSRRRPRSTTSASTTSSAARATAASATRSSIQGHAAPGIYARRVPRGSAHRGAPRPVPARGRRRRAPELPAPAPHARLLGVPDRVDGPRPAERGLPGTLQPLPAPPRDRRHQRGEGVVLRRRRRDGRARVDGRAVDRGAGAARQPDLRRELQPAAARRPGARQRQDHPGARGDVPRRGLERHQGDLGSRLGRAARARRRRRARQQDEQHRRRRVPEVRGRERARTSASTSSAPTRGCARWSSTCRDEDLRSCRVAVTTTASSTPPTRRRSSTRAAPP